MHQVFCILTQTSHLTPTSHSPSAHFSCHGWAAPGSACHPWVFATLCQASLEGICGYVAMWTSRPLYTPQSKLNCSIWSPANAAMGVCILTRQCLNVNECVYSWDPRHGQGLRIQGSLRALLTSHSYAVSYSCDTVKAGEEMAAWCWRNRHREMTSNRMPLGYFHRNREQIKREKQTNLWSFKG